METVVGDFEYFSRSRSCHNGLRQDFQVPSKKNINTTNFTSQKFRLYELHEICTFKFE